MIKEHSRTGEDRGTGGGQTEDQERQMEMDRSQQGQEEDSQTGQAAEGRV